MTKLYRFYKKYLSETLFFLFGGGCRFIPTCSEYWHEAFHKHNVIKASFLSVKRVLKCNPLFKGGIDPVP